MYFSSPIRYIKKGTKLDGFSIINIEHKIFTKISFNSLRLYFIKMVCFGIFFVIILLMYNFKTYNITANYNLNLQYHLEDYVFTKFPLFNYLLRDFSHLIILLYSLKNKIILLSVNYDCFYLLNINLVQIKSLSSQQLNLLYTQLK